MNGSQSRSITLPPAIWKQLDERAQHDDRSISEIVSDALRPYLYERNLADLRARHADANLTDADVVPQIHEFRHERRNRKVKRPA